MLFVLESIMVRNHYFKNKTELLFYFDCLMNVIILRDYQINQHQSGMGRQVCVISREKICKIRILNFTTENLEQNSYHMCICVTDG